VSEKEVDRNWFGENEFVVKERFVDCYCRRF
jgi:hypothetical protein